MSGDIYRYTVQFDSKLKNEGEYLALEKAFKEAAQRLGHTIVIAELTSIQTEEPIPEQAQNIAAQLGVVREAELETYFDKDECPF